jgi:hypothetical protein
MPTVNCPLCNVETNVETSGRSSIDTIQKSDSIAEPTGTVVCPEDHVFYVTFK